MKIIKVLSLDQSTKLTGYCLISNNKIIESGVLTVEEADKKNTVERLKIMKNLISNLIHRVKPDVIFFEDIQFQRNYQTYKQLAQLQGIIMAYLFQKDIAFVVVPPTKWKSVCGIKGRARKEQKKNTQKFVLNTYGLNVGEDESDAIGICHYAINSKYVKQN